MAGGLSFDPEGGIEAAATAGSVAENYLAAITDDHERTMALASLALMVGSLADVEQPGDLASALKEQMKRRGEDAGNTTAGLELLTSLARQALLGENAILVSPHDPEWASGA